MSSIRRMAVLVLVAISAVSCARSIYPSRPPIVPGPPVADPPLSRMVMHINLTRAGLISLLDGGIPQKDKGVFGFLGEREFRWQRGPLEVRLDQALGRVEVLTDIQGEADLPAKTLRFSMKLDAQAQPVISSDYQILLQTPVVSVTSDDRLLRLAEWSGGVLTSIRSAIEEKLRGLQIDLRPLLGETYQRVARPIAFAVGEAQACVELNVRTVEAGPNVLAGGFEKDVALTLMPSVTMPCTPSSPSAPSSSTSSASSASGPSVTLPALHNVAQLPTGPFQLVVPVAASYDELKRALSVAFSNGKLFFSKQHPELYLTAPEIWASGGELVVKVRIAGHVAAFFRMAMEGELFLSGHPVVRDNQLDFPDMQPTVETSNALLSLKTSLDFAAIQTEVQNALRVDISARLQAVKQRLSSELSFPFSVGTGSTAQGCVRADVGRIEVTGAFAHDGYMRLYLQASGQAAAYLPCPEGAVTSATP